MPVLYCNAIMHISFIDLPEVHSRLFMKLSNLSRMSFPIYQKKMLLGSLLKSTGNSSQNV